MEAVNQWPFSHRLFAHRGLHDSVRPENTLAAFAAAIEQNVAIELDVQLTADGVPIVLHDFNLARMGGPKTPVARMTWAEVSSFSHNKVEVPTLAQTLDLVNGRVPVLVEIKQQRSIGPLENLVCDLLRDYSGEKGILSFSPWTLRACAELLPQVLRGMSMVSRKGVPYWASSLASRAWFTRYAKANFLTAEKGLLLDSSWLSLDQRTMPLVVWTLTEQSQLDACGAIADAGIYESFAPAEPWEQLAVPV